MKMNKRKKIVIIGPVYPYRGGNSAYISYVYDSLIEKFDVKVINYKLLYPDFLFPGTTQYDKSGVVIKQVPSVRVINSVNPVSWHKAAYLIQKENPDLVVFDWWHPFFGPCHFTISSLLKLKKKYRNKIIFITENFISHEAHTTDRLLTRLGLSNADAFVALSDIVQRDIISTFGDVKVYRSELPIFEFNKMNSLDSNTAKAELGFKSSDKVLLFFGYVRKYKGLDILLRAFKGIKEKFPEMKLLVAGEFYDNPDEYFKIIRENNIEDDVKVVNQYIPNEGVYKYYSAADLVVQPYRSATQSGILNVAYGFLKPVVVTRVGGLEEFVDNEKTGIIVEPESSDEIIKGVSRFFELSDKINFKEHIENMVSKNKFRNLHTLFENILADSEKGFKASS
jgi:glycosyltransferase involved in cell wall biosynthesis